MKNVLKKVENLAKELIKDKKKITIIAGSILLVVIVLILLVVLLSNSKNQEQQLKENLEVLGREFYEDLYYPNTKNGDKEERAKFLAGFKEQGLKFNLDNLGRYKYKSEETQNTLDNFVNEKTNEECDKKESKIVIYPQEPYGPNDYKVEVILVCGFDTK